MAGDTFLSVGTLRGGELPGKEPPSCEFSGAEVEQRGSQSPRSLLVPPGEQLATSLHALQGIRARLNQLLLCWPAGH